MSVFNVVYLTPPSYTYSTTRSQPTIGLTTRSRSSYLFSMARQSRLSRRPCIDCFHYD